MRGAAAIIVAALAFAGCGSPHDLQQQRAEVVVRTCASFLERAGLPADGEVVRVETLTLEQVAALAESGPPYRATVDVLRDVCRPGPAGE